MDTVWDVGGKLKELLMILTITLLHAKVDSGLKAGTPCYVT